MTTEKLKTMNRGAIWNAAWALDSSDERTLMIGRWEYAAGNRYYDGEPRKEKKFRSAYEAIKIGGAQ